jgi:hypothetical protein
MSVFQRPAHWLPGLVRLWREGHPASLAVAVGFTALVNAALLATVVWPQSVTVWTRALLWCAVAAVWGGGALWDRHRRTARQGVPAEGAADLFSAVCREYLKGQWDSAERTARQLVRSRHDAEARLLLATLLRRTGRVREARRQLRRLERLEVAERWKWEIRREWELLEAGQSLQSSPPARSASPRRQRRMAA